MTAAGGRRLVVEPPLFCLYRSNASRLPMRWRMITVVLAALLVAACMHRGSSEQAQPALISVITRADIERIHARSALDAVQRLRSDVLTARAPSSVLLNKHVHPVV